MLHGGDEFGGEAAMGNENETDHLKTGLRGPKALPKAGLLAGTGAAPKPLRAAPGADGAHVSTRPKAAAAILAGVPASRGSSV